MAALPTVHVATPRNRQLPRAAQRQRVKAISLRQFYATARRSPDMQMAEWVRVVKVDKLRGFDGRPLFRCETSTSKPNTPPKRGHYCSVMPADPNYGGKISQCPSVMFDCNCQRWLFVWEYAMWYIGAARLLRGNGEFPVQTNPTLRPGGCKHLIRAAEALLARNY